MFMGNTRVSGLRDGGTQEVEVLRGFHFQFLHLNKMIQQL